MSDTVTRRRPARPAAQPKPCRCRRVEGGHDVGGRTVGGHLVPGGRPRTEITFRNSEVVDIRRIHWAGRDSCRLPDEELTLAEWLAT